MDRIDLHIELASVEYQDLISNRTEETSEQIKARVITARERQDHRFRQSHVRTNSEMTPRHIKIYCPLGQNSKQLLERALKELGFSARGYFKMIKIARTIADLEGVENIETSHLAEALQFRSLDRQYLGS